MSPPRAPWPPLTVPGPDLALLLPMEPRRMTFNREYPSSPRCRRLTCGRPPARPPVPPYHSPAHVQCQHCLSPRGPAGRTVPTASRASGLSTMLQAFLKASPSGSSVEEVEQLIRKHVIFQKVLGLQDKKVMGSGSPGQIFRRGSVAGCVPINSAGVSVALGVELYKWPNKRPRLRWSTLQGSQGALTLRSLRGEQFCPLPEPPAALNHAELRETAGLPEKTSSHCLSLRRQLCVSS